MSDVGWMQPAVIGPFLARNGRRNLVEPPFDLGYSLEWSSQDHHYEWDLVTKPVWEHGYPDASFAQRADVNLSDLFTHTFFESSRLYEIIAELGQSVPWIGMRRIPLLGHTGQWLSPIYGQAGLSLLKPRANPSGVETALIWRPPDGPKLAYMGIGALHWSEGCTTVLESIHYRGYASAPLRERFRRLLAMKGEPILSAEGEAHFREIFRTAETRRALRPKRVAPSADGLALAEAMQRQVQRGEPLGPAQVAALGDSSVARRLFRALAKRGADEACAAVSRAPGFSDQSAEECFRECVELGLTVTVEALFGRCSRKKILSKGALPALPLDLAVHSGSESMLAWCLGAFAPVDRWTLIRGVEAAAERREGSKRVLEAIIAARADPLDRWHALSSLFDAALDGERGFPTYETCVRLLELGYRPFDEVGWPAPEHYGTCHDALPNLLKAKRPGIFGAVFAFDPPTHEKLERLLVRHGTYPLADLGDIFSASRELPLHQRRVDRWALQLAAEFIRRGRDEHITMLGIAVEEAEATWETITAEDLDSLRLLQGSNFRTEQHNLISLISCLKHHGRDEMAKLMARLRRGPRDGRGKAHPPVT